MYFREFNIGRIGIRSIVIFVDGLSDKDLIDTNIMPSLMVDFSAEYNQDLPYLKGSISKEFIKNEVLSISEIEAVRSIKEIASKVLTGSTALLIDGSLDALILGTTKIKQGRSKSLYQRH
ncbi:spore germination protein [Peribacillus simplex]|uniref:spore germination protein n=1 Tax=Peribacillus simplex TaxID=1478 RepID=UPI003D070CD8